MSIQDNPLYNPNPTELPADASPFKYTPGGLSAGAPVDPKTLQGQILSGQRRYYNRFYKPKEQEILGRLTDPQQPEENAKTAGISAAAAADRSKADFQTQYGGLMSAQPQGVQESVERQFAYAKALGVTNAKNQTRTQTYDTNLGLLNQAIGIGRGVAASATQSANSAAGMQNQRDANNAAAKAASNAQDTQMAASAAATVVMAAAVIA